MVLISNVHAKSTKMPGYPRPRGKAKDIAYTINGVPSNMPQSDKYKKRLERHMDKSKEVVVQDISVTQFDFSS